MIEELIAEERELQALSQRQAVTEEQQSRQLRRKQRDELIDKLVLLLLCFSHTSQSQFTHPLEGLDTTHGWLLFLLSLTSVWLLQAC